MWHAGKKCTVDFGEEILRIETCWKTKEGNNNIDFYSKTN